MSVRIQNKTNWLEREHDLKLQIETWLKGSDRPRLQEIVNIIIEFEKKLAGE